MSVHFEVQRTINASQQHVYHSLYDLDEARNWMQGLVRMERLDNGPVQIGSAWRETRRMFGKEATEHFEVVEMNGSDKIVLRCDGTKGTTGKGEFVYTYTLKPSDEATEVTLKGEINGLTGITKLFGKLMSGMFSKACAKDLDALKSHLES